VTASTPTDPVGRAIRRERKAAGLTQAVLAERLGVSQPTIVRWEDGTRSPDLPSLFALADVLGIAPADLLTSEPSRPRLSGWPQVVEFQGTPMRIVQTEFGASDQTLCLNCGTHEHRKTITIRLVDEATFQSARASDV